MENYIVSARKYRPDTFDSVVGQEAITTTLKNAIKTGQLAQAFLFCGPRGVGKTTCARILSKTINCLNLTENMEACNKCESCESFNKNASFNIFELDAASNNSVQDIRNLVEQVRIPPQVGKYKVYIIDEVHMLSQAAFNAFLKTLEEPPAYAKFILATTEKNKIIPTILSRCQIFEFKRITVNDIIKHLKFVAEKEGVTAEEEALRVIALKSDGGMRDALSLFDQMVAFCGKNLTYKDVIKSLNVLDLDYFFKITDHLIDNDVQSVLLTINEIFDNGFDGQSFIIGFNEHLRNLLISKDPQTLKLLEESKANIDRYIEQSKKCSTSFIMYALNMMNKCDIDYRQSNNKHLLIEVGLINICYYLTEIQKKNNSLNLDYELNVPKDSNFRKKKNTSSTNSSNSKKSSQLPNSGGSSSSGVANGGTSNVVANDGTVSGVSSNNDGVANDGDGDGNGVAGNSGVEISTNDVASNFSKIQASAKVINGLNKNIKTKSFKVSNITVKDDVYENKKVLKSSYSIDDVKREISNFSDTINDDKILIKKTLKSSIDVVLQEDNVIEISCLNVLNQQEILSFVLELTRFLREKLKNDLISITTSVKEGVKVEQKAYTNRDKFKEMVEKNKDVLYLQEKLKMKVAY